MSWEETEDKALDYIQEYFDKDAYFCGGSNSMVSDIYTPRYSCYIEVKDLTHGARFGQFTNSTADKYKDYLEQGLDVFVNHWYENKGVGYFCLFSKGCFSVVDREAFTKYRASDFYLQSYAKRSGTRKPSKKAIEIFIQFYPIEQSEGRIYCHELEPNSYHRLAGYTFFINGNNEVRLRSNTCNVTWHVCLDR